MIGFFYILLFYWLGEAVALLIGNRIPGCVIGMLLLFMALYSKILSPKRVEKAATWLLDNMIIFFLPAAVGIITAVEMLSKHWLAIIVASVFSTLITMLVVGLIQQSMSKKNDTK